MIVVRYVVAVVLVLAGLVWMGQGLGFIPGSFMSGQQTWAILGAIFVALGAWLAWSTRRASRR